MQIIVSKTIDDDVLISSNVPENDYSEWNSGTTYNTGDRVIVTDEGVHKIYESLKDSNTNNYPPDNISGTDPWWLEVDATNRWKMFDPYVSTQTEYSGDIEITLDVTKCDYVAFFQLEADEISLSLEYNGEEVWTDTEDLLKNTSTSWSEYFFGSIEYKTDIAIQLGGLYSNNAELTVTVSALSGTAKCGHVVIGKASTLGDTKWEVRAGINDYSRRSTDSYGRTYLAQGYWSKRTELEVLVRTEAIDSIYKRLAGLRSTPCVWMINNESTDYETLLVYGFYRTFDVIFETPSMSTCNLEIEGLV